MNILLIDSTRPEDPELTRCLRQMGYAFTRCTSAPLARERLAQGAFDVLLLRASHLDEAQATLAALGARRGLPHTLALLDAAQPDDLDALLACGADDVVVPTEADALRVRLAVAQKQLACRATLDQGKDIGERKATVQRLQLSEQILSRVNNLILVADKNGEISYASPGVERTLGYTPKQVLGDRWFRLTHTTQQEQAQAQRRLAAQAQGRRLVDASPYERKIVDADGKPRWIMWQDTPGPDHTVIGIGYDVTQIRQTERALRQTEQRYQNIVEQTGMLIYTTDVQGRFTYANVAMQVFTGYPKREILDKRHADIIAPEWRRRVQAFYLKQLKRGQRETVFEFPIVTRSGETRWVEQTGTLIVEEGTVRGFQGIVRDVGERKRLESEREKLLKQVQQIAIRDALTGLYNRRHLDEMLMYELQRAQRYGHSLTLFILDLDGFKQVNDRLGHLKGDEVLRGVGHVLRKTLRDSDLAFRYGGDEFVALLVETGEQAQRATQRLHDAFRRWVAAHDWDGMVLSLSVGQVTWRPGAQPDPEALLREADRLLYEEKQKKNATRTEHLLFETTHQLTQTQTFLEQINAENHLESLLQLVLEQTVRRVPHADSGSALLLNEHTGELEFVAAVGWDLEALKAVHFKPAWNIQHVLYNDEPAIITDDVVAFQQKHWPPEERRTISAVGLPQSFLSVPIKLDNKVLGYFNINNKHVKGAFNNEDLRIACSTLPQIELALKRSHERRTSETHQRRLRLAFQLGQALAELTTVEALTQRAVDWAVANYAYDVVGVALVQGNGSIVAAHSGGAVSLIGQGFVASAKNLVNRAIQQNAVVWANDVQADPDYYEIDSRTRSELVVPIVFNDDVLGALNVESFHLSAFGRQDREVVSFLAGQLAVAINSLRRAQALQESEQRYSSIVNRSPVGVTIIQDGQFQFVSERFAELHGYSVNEMLSMDAFALILPEDRPLADKMLRRRIQGDTTLSPYVLRARHKDGSTKHFKIYGNTLQYAGKHAVMGTILDVTEQFKVEVERERLLVSEREQHLLAETYRETTLALTSHVDVGGVLNEILAQVNRLVRYSAANVTQLDGDTIRIVGGRGYQAVDTEQFTLGLVQPLDDFLLEKHVVKKRKPVVISNTAQDPRWVPMAETAWIRSFLDMPICANGQVLGTLRLDGESIGQFSERDVERLQPFVAAAAIALNNAQLHERALREVIERKRAQRETSALKQELEEAAIETVTLLARVIDEKDHYTAQHCERLAHSALTLGRQLALSEDRLSALHRAALLHDVGKVGIPEHILNKSGKLTPDEWELMKTHVRIGVDLISSIHSLKAAAEIAAQHHERWDGTGYPLGLKGEEILVEARILAVVDVWDALRTNRSYRRAWPQPKVIEHVREQRGKHFDPNVVEVFLELLPDIVGA